MVNHGCGLVDEAAVISVAANRLDSWVVVAGVSAAPDMALNNVGAYATGGCLDFTVSG